MIKEAYIWLGGCAAILAKSSKILLKEKGLGLLGSMVVVLAGVVAVVVFVVDVAEEAAPKVKGELVTVLLSGFLSLSPLPPMVPKEKSEVEGVEVEVEAAVVAGVLVAVEAAGAPKLKVGMVDFVVDAGEAVVLVLGVVAVVVVVVVVAALAGVPKEKPVVVAAVVAGVDLSSAGLLAAAGAPNVNVGVAAAGVVVVVPGVVEALAAGVAGFPKEKPVAAGVVVVLAAEEGVVVLEPNENGLAAAAAPVVVAVAATGVAGVCADDVLLAPNPNVGVVVVAGLSVVVVVAGLAPKLKADVAGVVVGVPIAGGVPKVILFEGAVEGTVAVVELLGALKLKPPIVEGVVLAAAGAPVEVVVAVVAGALNEILDD